MLRRLAPLTVFVLAFQAGCAPGGSIPTRDAGGGPPPAPGTDAGPPAPRPDAGPPIDAGFDECAADTTQAETGYAPVDVIWIVDRSGSMRGEADIVQSNINRFAADIDASGIDYHVIMISSMEFVTVPPPLGTDPDHFLYVEHNVQSSDGMTAPRDRFADYMHFLRPDAATHFVVVTDDESSIGAGAFQTEMEGLLGHDFTWHSIASPPGSTHSPPIPLPIPISEDGCTGPNGDAADNGDRYWALSMATGGQTLSICTADWSGLFSTLTAAIAVPVPLPCRYALPEAPEGMTLDRMKVNVLYTPTGGAEQIIPFVSDFGSCAGSGWYYEGDDIVVCPATCTTISADATGRVDIALGCETILM